MSKFDVQVSAHMPKQLLTIQEAAEYLGRSTKTLRRWDLAGSLTPIRTPGGQRRYDIEQLTAFKESKAFKKPEPSNKPITISFSHPTLVIKKAEEEVSQNLPKANLIPTLDPLNKVNELDERPAEKESFFQSARNQEDLKEKDEEPPPRGHDSDRSIQFTTNTIRIFLTGFAVFFFGALALLLFSPSSLFFWR